MLKYMEMNLASRDVFFGKFRQRAGAGLPFWLGLDFRRYITVALIICTNEKRCIYQRLLRNIHATPSKR